MKKVLFLLLVLCLILFGCEAQSNVSGEEWARFYYKDSEPSYFSDTGIMAAEDRSLGWDQHTVSGLMELYLQGPVSGSLLLPVPQGLKLLKTEVLPEEVTLIFDDSLAALSPMELHIAGSCIARTLWEYGDYQKITIKAQTQLLDGQEAFAVYPESLVLSDHGAGQPSTLIHLYFSGVQGRFLVEEQRSKSLKEEESLPEYVLQALLEGPDRPGLLTTIPEGTLLLDVSVADGVCIVNFSSEFLQNLPKEELQQRMTVFSVVNSLTQLDEISSVEFLVEGSPVEQYGDVDLSEALVFNETLIGPAQDDADAS